VRASAAVLAFVMGIVIMALAEFVRWLTNITSNVLPMGGVDFTSGAITVLRGGALLLMIMSAVLLYFEVKQREGGF